jgi:hypothetical protein
MAVVKLMTAQVTKLPLKHKVRKRGMISVNHVLTEGLCVGQKEEFSVTFYVYVRNVHLTKDQTYS